jgi:hypothetical protein
LAHYRTVLQELYQEEIPIPKTGKPGRPKKPIKSLNSELKYATVKKTRKNGHIDKVERKIIFGSS